MMMAIHLILTVVQQVVILNLDGYVLKEIVPHLINVMRSVAMVLTLVIINVTTLT